MEFCDGKVFGLIQNNSFAGESREEELQNGKISNISSNIWGKLVCFILRKKFGEKKKRENAEMNFLIFQTKRQILMKEFLEIERLEKKKPRYSRKEFHEDQPTFFMLRREKTNWQKFINTCVYFTKDNGSQSHRKILVCSKRMTKQSVRRSLKC